MKYDVIDLLLAMAALDAALVPEFDRTYFHYSRKAFNLVRYLVQELQFDDSVFSGALRYWHEFIRVHGLGVMNEMLLAAACVFLSAKVLHYKFRLERLVRLAFDLNGGDGRVEEEGTWCAALLDAELILCDTLDFCFHVDNVSAELVAEVSALAQKERLMSSEEETTFLAQVIGRAERLCFFTLISPVLNRITSRELRHSLLFLVVQHSPCAPHAQRAHRTILDDVKTKLPAPPIVKGVLSVVVDIFVLLKKKTGVPGIDSLLEEQRHVR